MFDLQNKVALVTGATAGIGRAVALALAQEGARVVVAGRREHEGHQVVEQIHQASGSAHFVRTDVSQETEVAHLVQQTVAQFGRLDIAVNNAGVTVTGTATDFTREDYERVFNTNVLGVALCLKYQIAAMLGTGGGSIINLSSVAGCVGLPFSAIYCASKHAVEGLTRCAALDFAREGIRVNTIAPAGIATDMLEQITGGLSTEAGRELANRHPVGRIGTPEEVAAAVIYLASDVAKFVTGITLPIDGGWLAR